MFTLLAPAALVGLSLLAIPVIIHLLRPRKVRRTPFSSLRWLHLTQQRLSRRVRWHQLLLFLLRAAIVGLLVLAVARPVWDRSAQRQPSERFIIVDVSRSMGYRNGQEPSPLDRGKSSAARLLESGGLHDRTALLAVGGQARVIGTPAPGGQQHLSKLLSLQVENTDTDLGSALDLVRSFLSGKPQDARVELYFITDRHQGSWRAGAVESFLSEYPGPVQATLIDVAPTAAQNGWIADARFLPAEGTDPPAVDVQLRATGNGPERTLRLTGLAGLSERSHTVVLDPNRPVDVRFELPADFDPRHRVCEIVLDPPDPLPSDDRWYLLCDGGPSLRVLLIVGATPDASGANPGFTLRTAIESLSTGDRSHQLVAKKYNELEPADLDQVDLVLCADVPELSDAAVEALSSHVNRGLGLGIFLGPSVDVAFYNRQLIDPLNGQKSLLPAPLERVIDVPLSAGGLAPIEAVSWQHPLLAGLFDPALGDLAGLRVRSYYRWGEALPGPNEVLAQTGGVPLIWNHATGQGKVIVLNLTADDRWSDLPRRKSFVPLVDRLLTQLAGGRGQRAFVSGQAVTLHVLPLAAGESLSVTTPQGQALNPSLTPLVNGARLQLPPLTEPGVYRVRRKEADGTAGQEPPELFVVQTGRGDSDVRPIDSELLRAWWQPQGMEVVSPDAPSDVAASGGIALSVWAVLLAAGLLALETLLVARLCPKMLPRVASPIVQRRSAVSTDGNSTPVVEFRSSSTSST